MPSSLDDAGKVFKQLPAGLIRACEWLRAGPNASWSHLGLSWSALGAVLKSLGALLGPSRGLLERSWGRLEGSWSALGAVLKPPGALLRPSRRLLERSWGRLEGSWSTLEAKVAPTMGFSSFLESQSPRSSEIPEPSGPSYENYEVVLIHG